MSARGLLVIVSLILSLHTCAYIADGDRIAMYSNVVLIWQQCPVSASMPPLRCAYMACGAIQKHTAARWSRSRTAVAHTSDPSMHAEMSLNADMMEMRHKRVTRGPTCAELMFVCVL